MTSRDVAREQATDDLRRLLCDLGSTVQHHVLASCERPALDQAVGESQADVVYGLDRIAETAALDWFERHWPSDQPVDVVMEGLDSSLRVGRGTPRWTCILDPVDGTRCLMTQKRSAWVLAALAPHGGGLADIAVCAMTELPPTRQWRADQVSAVRGRGLVCRSTDLRAGVEQPLTLQPSRATDVRHGFASLAKFFPEGKARIAALEERLWTELYGTTRVPLVFDDQYVSTGGQVFELLSGRDRMVGDIRPYVLDRSLACHPYDVCTGMLIAEAGGVFEAPAGGPVNGPLDTTSAIAWIGYANPMLADLVRPILKRLLREV